MLTKQKALAEEVKVLTQRVKELEVELEAMEEELNAARYDNDNLRGMLDSAAPSLEY